MKRILHVGLILMLAAVVFPSTAHAGFIFGAGVGDNTVNVDEDFDESDMGWKAFAGFRFIKFFGVEVQYVEFGTPENSDFSVKLTDIAAFAVGAIPIGDHFEFFGKAGYGNWNIEIEDLNLAEDVDADEWDLVYGAGLAVIFGEHVGFRLEYERFEVQDTDGVDMASASIDIRL